jgi:xylose isomerase
MSAEFFTEVHDRIGFGGPDADDPLSYAVYQPDRTVLGKRLEDHLRIAVCLWHSFNWPGSDVFGVGTFDRPWLAPAADVATATRAKLDAAFEFISKLGAPFFTFHDRDVAPEGRTYVETRANLEASVSQIEAHMERTGARLLWGTANLFSHPRYAAGAATNPDPEVFAYAAAQVKTMLEVTNRLHGANYVLWGGREGYETLLNTDLAREEAQLARFLTLVAEHKHRIGFNGTLLIEPKPQEPTKHQYDYDVATVVGFLQRHGLADEYRLNLEVNHATLAGHSFHHEVATAIALGFFGSVDVNRGDYQNGWDTDQFPNSVDELALALHEILAAGGFTAGGFNFDTKLRRQSVSRTDLFHAHIGAIDTLARALLVAADMIDRRTLAAPREERYAGWSGELGEAILGGGESLADLERRVATGGIDPRPRSGQQELLEGEVNRRIWAAERLGSRLESRPASREQTAKGGQDGQKRGERTGR